MCEELWDRQGANIATRYKEMFNELASAVSVSVGLGRKERPRNGIFGVLPGRKMGREPKTE